MGKGGGEEGKSLITDQGTSRWGSEQWTSVVLQIRKLSINCRGQGPGGPGHWRRAWHPSGIRKPDLKWRSLLGDRKELLEGATGPVEPGGSRD